MKKSLLKTLAAEHGTPLVVIDHDVLRRNYAMFRRGLPRVQAYYAAKANPEPAILKTFYEAGASFDVASIAEFRLVYEQIRRLSAKQRRAFVWDQIIYANPIKDCRTLRELNRYRPLVTYDNRAEVEKIREHAPQAGLVLRIRVPNTGSAVELSSKFGALPADAVDLIAVARDAGLTVEGLSFHVGSQCTNFQNYIQALEMASNVMEEAEANGVALKLLDIGGGFPAPYEAGLPSFRALAAIIRTELDRLFPKELEILAEPGRFLVATAATAVAEVIGKAERDGKPCYYLNDGIYGTFSGIFFDHCRYPIKAMRGGRRQVSAVFGPTCDALDTISQAEVLPDLKLGDLVYAENIGAYSSASATGFNGFPPATVVHIHRKE